MRGVLGRLLAARERFSLRELARVNAPLARHFQWSTNVLPADAPPFWLHLGCGERVLDGFVNVDFIPHDERVLPWDLLDLWPEALRGLAAGVFSEDVLEHFFFNEQVYILCNVNRALRDGAVARTLMPSQARLIDYCRDYDPAPDEFLHASFGVATGADALNLGMRFSGHRWLHDAVSLARLAALCGFEATTTPCATSTVDKFNGINLRDEDDSLSFATDLRKIRTVQRLSLQPATVSGASVVEELGEGIRLYAATAATPRIDYASGEVLDRDAVVCINVRSSCLSSFDEHNQKTLVLDEANRARPWYFDETMKSRPCMNVATRSEIAIMLGDAPAFSRMEFSPAARAGAYFTLGCAEVYLLA